MVLGGPERCAGTEALVEPTNRLERRLLPRHVGAMADAGGIVPGTERGRMRGIEDREGELCPARSCIFQHLSGDEVGPRVAGEGGGKRGHPARLGPAVVISERHDPGGRGAEPRVACPAGAGAGAGHKIHPKGLHHLPHPAIARGRVDHDGTVPGSQGSPEGRQSTGQEGRTVLGRHHHGDRVSSTGCRSVAGSAVLVERQRISHGGTVRISVAACELPHPEGTAAGRDLWAWCDGLLSLGHEVDAWVWYRSASSPKGPVPEWCRYEPFDPGSRWRSHARALLRPRQDAVRAGWSPAPDAVAVADHLWSFAAVAPFERSVATFHFRSLADAVATRRVVPADLQMARAERFAGRRAAVVLAYSDRVGRHLRQPAHVVPIAYPPPPQPVEVADAPVAALLADWSWPPNRVALGRLLGDWAEVRRIVPSARLLLAGRHIERAGIGHVAGVETLGPIGSAADLLAQAGVIAFPCPPSSGPKLKVLEAMAYGLPVVTSRWGAEGVLGPPGSGPVVAGRRTFAATLAALLLDHRRRRDLGAAGRAAACTHHSPEAAALARVTVFTEAFATGTASP